MHRKASDSVSNVLEVFSITNGGLPKFEAKWKNMTEAERRIALNDAKKIASILQRVLFCVESDK